MVKKKTREAYLTAARFNELFRYDPKTGHIIRISSGKKMSIGSIAGALRPDGYRVIGIDYRLYRAPRLAFLAMTGHWPPPGTEIDHINGNRDDNRWSNLRLASISENHANSDARLEYAGKRSTKFKGVGFHRGKYRAYISVNGRYIHLGHFDTPEEAHAAYVEAAKKYFGEFARAT